MVSSLEIWHFWDEQPVKSIKWIISREKSCTAPPPVDLHQTESGKHDWNSSWQRTCWDFVETRGATVWLPPTLAWSRQDRSEQCRAPSSSSVPSSAYVHAEFLSQHGLNWLTTELRGQSEGRLLELFCAVRCITVVHSGMLTETSSFYSRLFLGLSRHLAEGCG